MAAQSGDGRLPATRPLTGVIDGCSGIKEMLSRPLSALSLLSLSPIHTSHKSLLPSHQSTHSLSSLIHTSLFRPSSFFNPSTSFLLAQLLAACYLSLLAHSQQSPYTPHSTSPCFSTFLLTPLPAPSDFGGASWYRVLLDDGEIYNLRSSQIQLKAHARCEQDVAAAPRVLVDLDSDREGEDGEQRSVCFLSLVEADFNFAAALRRVSLAVR